MGVYIKGMEMPKAEFGSMIVAIRPDGMVEDVMGCYVGKADPVPPHGRLIDADELSRAALENFFFHFVPRWMVKEAPTVIPADKDGET